jgi:hypothetical protein
MHLSYRNAPLWYLAVITNSDVVKQEEGISGEGHREGEIGEERCEGTILFFSETLETFRLTESPAV